MADDWVEKYYEAYSEGQRANATKQRRQLNAMKSVQRRWDDLLERLRQDADSVNEKFAGQPDCQLKITVPQIQMNTAQLVIGSTKGSLSLWNEEPSFKALVKASSKQLEFRIEVVADSDSDSVLYQMGQMRTADPSDISEKLLILLLCR